MTTVKNPVSREFFDCEGTSGRVRSRKCLLSVGRLEPQKDHATLVLAFARLADQYREWDLRIVGDGNLRPRLLELVCKYGLHNRVFMPGIVRNIKSEMQDSDIFALPSRYESFGLVILEAMACGKPCVAFADCPGVNELVVSGETGLLVSGDDRVSAMAEGLRALMDQEAWREGMGVAARSAISGYSIESVCQEWGLLIAELSGAHAKQRFPRTE